MWRSTLPSALPCCITERSLWKAPVPRWSPIPAPGRFILATDALAVEGIHAYYGDSHVLHDVSFSLKAGSLLGLLGRNGAGKTTCMSTIIGLLRPRRGTIALYGEPIGGLAPDVIARKGVSLVPQGRRGFRSLTLRGNFAGAAQAPRPPPRPPPAPSRPRRPSD